MMTALLTASHHCYCQMADGTCLDLDNNTLDKTSVTGCDVEDHANDDDGLTFDDYEEDPNDVVPVYIGVPQRNIVPVNNTLMAKVELGAFWF